MPPGSAGAVSRNEAASSCGECFVAASRWWPSSPPRGGQDHRWPGGRVHCGVRRFARARSDGSAWTDKHRSRHARQRSRSPLHGVRRQGDDREVPSARSPSAHAWHERPRSHPSPASAHPLAPGRIDPASSARSPCLPSGAITTVWPRRSSIRLATFWFTGWSSASKTRSRTLAGESARRAALRRLSPLVISVSDRVARRPSLSSARRKARTGGPA